MLLESPQLARVLRDDLASSKPSDGEQEQLRADGVQDGDASYSCEVREAEE